LTAALIHRSRCSGGTWKIDGTSSLISPVG
jgi:hypothetical protein